MSLKTFNPSEMTPRQSYKLMTSLITPRPIAWVSTLSAEGVPNLAPYSFFNAVASNSVMISVGQRRGAAKDTLVNVQAVPEMVINLVSEAHADAMNITSGNWTADENEFEKAKLQTEPSEAVRPLRVAGVPAALEVVVKQLVPLQDAPNTLVIGQVVRFHVREDLLNAEGRVNSPAMRLIARLGGKGYLKGGTEFELIRPD